MNKTQLKRWLKFIKTHEDTGSTALGAAVVVLFVLTVVLFVKRSPNSSEIPSNDSEILLPEAVDLPEVRISTDSSQQATPPTNSRMHTVRPGEGLWQIAEQYYQDGNRYLEIYQANTDKMSSPEDIQVGMELKIP